MALPTKVSDSVRRLNPQLFGHLTTCTPGPIEYEPMPDLAPKKRVRQSSTPLNKLETAYQSVLHERHGVTDVVAQAIRLRLGNGSWYKPDFFVKSQLLFIEVKGPHAFRGGFEYLKIAAAIHTWAKFRLVWRDNGEWMFQDILP